MITGIDICETIIQPIEESLKNGSNYTPRYGWTSELIKRIEQQHRKEEFAKAIKPYVIEIIFYPEERYLRHERVGDIVYDIIRYMSFCDQWGQMIEHFDVIDLLEKTMQRRHNGYDGIYIFKFLMINASRKGINLDWDELYVIVREKLRDKEIKKDRFHLELYAFLMAIIMIERSDLICPEKYNQLDLLKDNWNIISYLYALVLNRIIGTEYKKYIQLAELTCSNNSRLAFGRLFLDVADWAYKRNPNNFSAEPNFGARLDKLRKAVDGEYQESNLNKLVQILFPEVYGKTIIRSKPSQKDSSSNVLYVENLYISDNHGPIIKVDQSQQQILDRNISMTGNGATYNENNK